MTKEEQAELDNMAAILPKAGDPVAPATETTPEAEPVQVAETPASEETTPVAAEPVAAEKPNPATEFAKTAEQISQDNAPVADDKVAEDLAKALGLDPAKIDKAKVVDALTRKAQSMYTKSQQKTKSMLERKLEETINDLKGSELFVPTSTAPVDEVKALSDDELIKASGLEDNEDARRLVKVSRAIARSEAAPALNARAQLDNTARQAVEREHWDSLRDQSKGFAFTKQMFDQAAAIQQQPAYKGFTVAQILQAQHAPAIQDHILNIKAEAMAQKAIEAFKKEFTAPKEHPGGKPGAAQRKTAPTVDPSKLSDKDFFAWADNGGLPKADDHP